MAQRRVAEVERPHSATLHRAKKRAPSWQTDDALSGKVVAGSKGSDLRPRMTMHEPGRRPGSTPGLLDRTGVSEKPIQFDESGAQGSARFISQMFRRQQPESVCELMHLADQVFGFIQNNVTPL